MTKSKTLKLFSELSFETGFAPDPLKAASAKDSKPRMIASARSEDEIPAFRVWSLRRGATAFKPAVPGHRWGINE